MANLIKTETFDLVYKAILKKGPTFLESHDEIHKFLKEINMPIHNINEEVYSAFLAAMIHWSNSMEEESEPALSDRNLTAIVGSIASFFKEINKPWDWRKIILSLDRPKMIFKSVASYTALTESYKAAMNSKDFPAIKVFFEPWENKDTQFSFLAQIFNVNQFQDLTQFCTQFALPDLDIIKNKALRERLLRMTQTPWVNLELINACLRSVGPEKNMLADAIIQGGLKTSPDLIFFGLLLLLPFKNEWHRNTLSKLYANFLDNPNEGSFPLYVNWIISSTALFEGLYHCLVLDDKYFGPILKIFKNIDLISALYFSNDFDFTLPLIALAHKKRYINLQHWIDNKLDEFQDAFVSKSLEFIYRYSKKLVPEVNSQDNDNLTYETIAVFFQVFFRSKLPNNLESNVKACLNAITELYSPFQGLLLDFVQQDNIIPKFPTDIEEDVNNLYERLYKNFIQPSDLAEGLVKLRSSLIPRDLTLYGSCVSLLVEEYHSLKEYPDIELGLTGIFLGQLIIKKGLVYSYNKMLILCIANGLVSTPHSKLHSFSCIAMTQIKDFVNQIPLLQEFFKKYPQLLEEQQSLSQEDIIAGWIGKVKNQKMQDAYQSSFEAESIRNNETFNQPPIDIQQAKTGPSLNIPNPETVLTTKYKPEIAELDQELKEKMVFIINNLSSTNIEEKAKDFKAIVNQSAYTFFSNYIVVHRISSELNNHTIYLKFLDLIDDKGLMSMILEDTYRNIHVLLNAKDTATSTSERTFLKTLGSWLGAITLARNKPVLHDKLYLKGILADGYLKDRLIVSIPFTCKVLAQGIKGEVFKPPNPWLMGVLRFLLELSKIPGSKNSLNFEIEMLFNNFNLKTNDIEPSQILKNIELYADQDTSRSQISTKYNGEPFDINNFTKYIQIDKSSSFDKNENLRYAVHRAFEIAVANCLEAIKGKAITSACFLVKELVLKDFAMEPNEEKLRQAAHEMGCIAAASFANVNSRELFLNRFAATLRELIIANDLVRFLYSPDEIEDVVFNNLRPGIFAIHTFTYNETPHAIDSILQEAINNRKKSRERNGQPYYDMALYNANNYPSNLPDILKIKPNGLTQSQLRIYHNFNLMSLEMPESLTRDEIIKHISPETLMFIQTGRKQPQAVMPDEKAKDIFLSTLNNLDRHLNMIKDETDAMEQTVLIQLFDTLDNILKQLAGREQLLLDCAQKYLLRIYTTQSKHVIWAYIQLLSRMFQYSSFVAQEVNNWLIYNDDKLKHNTEATKYLLISNLIDCGELDKQLGQWISTGRGDVADFGHKLIRKCLLEDPYYGTFDGFINIREGLLKLSRLTQTYDQVRTMLEDVKAQCDAKKRERELQATCHFYHNEWMRVYQLPNPNEKDYFEFVSKLSQHGILEDEQMMAMFIRTSAQVSFDSFAEQSLRENGDFSKPPYHTIDSMAKMIVIIIIYAKDQHNENLASRAGLFTNTLTVLALMLASSHHYKEKNFNPKPFFRLYSSLLYQIHAHEDKLEQIETKLLLAFNNTLTSIKPDVLPGFAFAWVSLVSHKLFLPKIMAIKDNLGWKHAHLQFCNLFKFLSTILTPTPSKTGYDFYVGVLRLARVLMADYPAFVVAYHFSFISEIPMTCTQLRNILSSTCPEKFEHPRPCSKFYNNTVNPEFLEAPPVLSDYTTPLENKGIADGIRKHILNRDQVEFLVDLKPKLSKYADYEELDVHLLYCLAFFVAVTDLETKSTVPNQAAMDIYQKLLIDFDTIGRHTFLNVLFGFLRYPNLHTKYFSKVILNLFATTPDTFVKEQIIRVMLDRMIPNIPVPWGVWSLFLDLYEDPEYQLLNQPFAKNNSDLLEYMERCASYNRAVPA